MMHTIGLSWPSIAPTYQSNLVTSYYITLVEDNTVQGRVTLIYRRLVLGMCACRSTIGFYMCSFREKP